MRIVISLNDMKSMLTDLNKTPANMCQSSLACIKLR